MVNKGQVIKSENLEPGDSKDKVVILFSGSAKSSDKKEEIIAPVILDHSEFEFSKDVHLFVCLSTIQIVD